MKLLSVKPNPQELFCSINKLFEEVREKTFSNPQYSSGDKRFCFKLGLKQE